MNILLINPPFYRLMGLRYPSFPIGLGYLGSVLNEKGHKVQIYNVEHDTENKALGFLKITENYDNYLNALQDNSHPIWDEVRQRIQKIRPDLVGVTVMTPKLASALKVAEIVKDEGDIPVVFGGPHPTVAPHDALVHACVDYVVRGEGEKTFAELLDCIHGSKDAGEVTGVSFKTSQGTRDNPNRELIRDIDVLPFPGRDLLLDVESYSPEALGWMVTSRGCPYKCTYCAAHMVWGRRVRFRSPENIIAEIKYVKEKYRTREFYFRDDSFTVNRERVLDLCRRLREENVDVYRSCDTRADLLDEEILSEMKAAGCTNIALGVESGSERILKFIKKGVTKLQISSAAELIRDAGLQLSVFFMIGFPTETKDEMRESIRFMKKLNPDNATFSIVTPYVGTELYDFAVETGKISPNVRLESLSHQSPHINLSELSNTEFREMVGYAELVFDDHNKTKLRNYRIKNMFVPFTRLKRRFKRLIQPP